MRLARPGPVVLGLSAMAEGLFLIVAPHSAVASPGWDTIRDTIGLSLWGAVWLITGTEAVFSTLAKWDKGLFASLMSVTLLQTATATVFLVSAGSHGGAGIFGALQAITVAALTLAFGIRTVGV